MTDLIERRYFTDAVILEYLGPGFASCAPDIRDMVADAPTVDAVPARHGHWIVRREGTYLQTRVYCSWCGKRSGIGGILENQLKPFCPHCGAKMDEEHENETD